jgi:predicted glycoside hydrolase/deacetylase ChbG (UPF0249 family)
VSGARPTAPGAALPAARRWVACADDYAIDAGAIDGIADLLARGRLTATSALVDAPHWRSAATALPAAADIGLHLNLTQAFAPRPARTWPLVELIVRARAGLLPRAQVRDSIERQLDAFESGLGRRPDYIDGHQHVHQFATVRDELLAALHRRYAANLPWIRVTRAPPGVGDLKARFIALLGDAGLRRRAARIGAPMSDWLVGVYGFEGGAPEYLERLRRWLAAGPDGSVLMCHPARSAPGDDPIGRARVAEFAVLESGSFSESLDQAGVRLVRGSACFAA